jgi:hypothetical protein
VGDVDVHAFVTTLSPRHCRGLIQGVDTSGLATEVRLRHDAATQVTVVHTVRPRGCDRAEDQQRLEALLGCFVADEVLVELADERS